MKIYAIFERPGGALDDPGNGVIFVKQGFCWPALLWPLIWSLYHRMWAIAGVYLGVSLTVGLIGEMLGAQHPLALIVALCFALLVAFEANGIRGLHLLRQGYQQVATVAAEELVQAEQRYFSERLRDPFPPPFPDRGREAVQRPGGGPSSSGWGFLTPDTPPGASR